MDIRRRPCSLTAKPRTAEIEVEAGYRQKRIGENSFRFLNSASWGDALNDRKAFADWLKIDGIDVLVELALNLHWSWNHNADWRQSSVPN
jgi:hypothetical protein